MCCILNCSTDWASPATFQINSENCQLLNLHFASLKLKNFLQRVERDSAVMDALVPVYWAILWEHTILRKVFVMTSSHDISLAGGSMEEAVISRHKTTTDCETLRLLCKTKSSIQELNISTNVSKSQWCVCVCMCIDTDGAAVHTAFTQPSRPRGTSA